MTRVMVRAQVGHLNDRLDALHLASLIMRVRRATAWSARVCVIDASFFERDLSRMTLDGVDLQRCVLDRASLQRSTWRGARVHECSLVGAMLVDTVLDEMVMVDCDLRCADLSVVKLGARATMRGLRLERCDLRASNWQGRDLGDVTLIDCKAVRSFRLTFVGRRRDHPSRLHAGSPDDTHR